MPNTEVRKRPAILSALVAAVGWILWQKIYINLQVSLARYNAIYGTFASVPIFLLWLYVGCMIILFGAELAFALQNHNTFALERAAGRASARCRTLLAIAALREAARVFAAGGRLDAAAFADAQRFPIRLLNDVLRTLALAGFTAEVADHPGCHLLARAPESIRLREVAALFGNLGAGPAELGLAELEARWGRGLDRGGEENIAQLVETA
jgi:membrane protein